MNILFLDIDGVLNDHQLQDNGCCGIKPECVYHLNYILRTIPDLQLVVSSAWRYMILSDSMTRKGFENMLMVCGVDCRQRVLGNTCGDEEIKERRDQIKQFIGRYDFLSGNRYVVLDDMDLGYTKAGLTFVQTDGGKGLTAADALRVVSYFK